VHSDPTPVARKVLIAGGCGVGTTTAIGSVSEIDPLHTEATIGFDFGRVTISADFVLYLFGTPGQTRFSFVWDEMARGAMAVLVIVDTRNLETSFPAIDYCESRGMPFVIAVNAFDDAPRYSESEVRDATAVGPEVPVLFFDARDQATVRTVLATLAEHAIAAPRRAPRP